MRVANNPLTFQRTGYMAKGRKIYRDRDTGRFASKTTYTRSKAHGGTRYKTEKIASVVREPEIKSATGTKEINSLKDFFEYGDFDYQENEFETGLDYGREG
jgi:hypothetical protein